MSDTQQSAGAIRSVAVTINHPVLGRVGCDLTMQATDAGIQFLISTAGFSQRAVIDLETADMLAGALNRTVTDARLAAEAG